MKKRTGIEMRRGGWILAVALGVVGLAIAAGLMVVGGPEQGRADSRDERRFNDLLEIRYLLDCHYRETGEFPAALEKTQIVAACRSEFPDAQDLQDPQSGAPYGFERLDTQTVRLCARFEADEMRLRALLGRAIGGFDMQTGCLTMQRK